MMASDLVFDYNSALIEYIKTIKLCEIDIDKSSLISTDDLKFTAQVLIADCTSARAQFGKEL